MWPDLTLSAHDVVSFLSWAVCYCEDLSGAIYNPNIIEAWEVGIC